MFRRNKTDYKAKLEHKLYLARENPEPIFDLSDCGLRQVPSGIFSLCRVFLKETLLLDHNKLTALSNGGVLRDLCGLKVLHLQFNSFTLLPEDLSSLSCLRELYLNNNTLKRLPKSVGSLKNLRILDVSNNALRTLPNEIGNLSKLNTLLATENKHLNHLPHAICRLKRLSTLCVDSVHFIYPPTEVMNAGIETIMKYICSDNDVKYEPLLHDDITSDDDDDTSQHQLIDQHDGKQNVGFEVISINRAIEQEKIWEFERLKQQKLKDILKIEKEYETYQRQELELQAALKENRQKFLTDLSEQQNKLESELARIQHKKEEERLRLVTELQDEESKADLAITNLLNLMREPLNQLLEQEQQEEERLLAAAAKYNCNLRKHDILDAMKTLLEGETDRFKQYDLNREESARSILSQELMSDSRLSDVLRVQGEQQAELVLQLQQDMELQRIAVGALLERGDARSWSLQQQVHLVETQLAKLTAIEIDRRKLEMDEHLNDLSDKRGSLSMLLLDLLEQQGARRTQLLSTLQNMEQVGKSQDDFWLMQYQQLLDRRPTNLTDVQRNIDPEFAQELLLAGVIQYLPFLADWVQTSDMSSDELSDAHLIDAGIHNESDRQLISQAYYNYRKLRSNSNSNICTTEASAPVCSVEQSSTSTTISSTECVICMDKECEIIFVPCGHMCCCTKCSTVIDCPLCRGVIERKIRVLLP